MLKDIYLKNMLHILIIEQNYIQSYLSLKYINVTPKAIRLDYSYIKII